MYLNKMGYHVTAFSTNLNRAEEYKKLGAHETLHSTDVATLDKNQSKFSYVISTTFFNENNILKKHINLTRKNGTFTMVALGDKDNLNAIDIGTLVFKQINFQGSIIGSYNEICVI
jgi:D-arabinose 1-dehydrogenase-like Zn-dependent alcohol dehydrogenase